MILPFQAGMLGIGGRVFRIDGFLEKVVAENPDQQEGNVLNLLLELPLSFDQKLFFQAQLV
jgi:hypothetical protein